MQTCLNIEAISNTYVCVCGRLPLVISFTPTKEGPVVFNLLIAVRGKVQPLTLNVKAEGYSMNAYLQFESPEGVFSELSPTNVHLVDFKIVSHLLFLL